MENELFEGTEKEVVTDGVMPSGMLTVFSESDTGDAGDGERSADAGQGSHPAEGDDGEFERLIKGPYKDAYTRRTQNMINRRFRETKELEAFRDRAGKLIDALSEHFGVEGDIESIMGALDGVKSAPVPAAGDGGAPAPAPRETEEDAGAEHAARMISRAKAVLGTAAEYGKFTREAEDMKKIYPSFDLEKECRDPRFTKLAAAGLGIRGAYEAVHHNELLAGAMQYAADRVFEAARSGVGSASLRPEENGTAGEAAHPARRGAASLSEKEIMNILKRVERGERISF